MDVRGIDPQLDWSGTARLANGSEVEVLVIGNCFLRKEDQDPALKLDYKNAFELD